MSLRVIEILADADARETIETRLGEIESRDIHAIPLANDQVLVRALVQAGALEEFTAWVDSGTSRKDVPRLLILPVEATLPTLDEQKETEQVQADEPKAEISAYKFIRISKEELRQDIEETVRLNLNFLLLVILSSIVAGIGILKESLPIIIGAMVIAPFLGPNVALSFGAVIGDAGLIRKGLKTSLIATGIGVGIAVIWGLIDEGVHQITQPATIEYRDIVLALTCGFAGVLSMMAAAATSLVGVMVAAALLPPLVRAGLFLGAGAWTPALNDGLLFLTNVLCVQIAGIVMFHVTGVRPSRWWEQKQADQHRRTAQIVYALILVVVVVLIYLLRTFGTAEVLS